jgi:hypothetical protein
VPEVDTSLTGVTHQGVRHSAARAREGDVWTLTEKLAVLTIRRQCNQHQCSATPNRSCRDINHRRDVDYLLHMLQFPGLSGVFPTVTEEDRKNWLTGLKSISPPSDLSDV